MVDTVDLPEPVQPFGARQPEQPIPELRPDAHDAREPGVRIAKADGANHRRQVCANATRCRLGRGAGIDGRDQEDRPPRRWRGDCLRKRGRSDHAQSIFLAGGSPATRPLAIPAGPGPPNGAVSNIDPPPYQGPPTPRRTRAPFMGLSALRRKTDRPLRHRSSGEEDAKPRRTGEPARKATCCFNRSAQVEGPPI